MTGGLAPVAAQAIVQPFTVDTESVLHSIVAGRASPTRSTCTSS
jgi:hypothetical protein